MCTGASSQTVSRADMRALRVEAGSTEVFAGSECMFSLAIPDADSADVQADTPELPAGVSFISMKRTGWMKDGVLSGAEIDIWLSFRSAGTYKLSPLNVKVRNRSYRIPFENITVLENPALIVPVLIFHFDNGVECRSSDVSDIPLFSVPAGTSIGMTLFLQYAVQVVQFEWTAPENTLFTELNRYEITKGTPRGGGYSAERIPVARFDWQPLRQGNNAVPSVTLTATSYSGARTVLSQPKCFVSVAAAPPETVKNAETDESYFSYAFSEVKTENSSDDTEGADDAVCEKIAMLRTEERHMLFHRSKTAERKALEESCGIMESRNEMNWPAVFLTVVAGAVLIACGVFYAARRRRTPAAVLLICGSGILLCAVSFAAALLQTQGIFEGGSLRSVPEQSSGIVSEMESGHRVRIADSAGAWTYIEGSTVSGWVPSDTVIVIH